jgi:rhodanese-related sulfurtransferase
MKTAHDMVEEARAGIREVPIADAEAAVLGADLVIDVREGDEYREGHIGGSVNIPRGLLEFIVSNDPALQDRALSITLYCKTSGRAALAAKTLRDMGYLHVTSIAGGFDAWKQAGKPVAQPTQPDFS